MFTNFDGKEKDLVVENLASDLDAADLYRQGIEPYLTDIDASRRKVLAESKAIWKKQLIAFIVPGTAIVTLVMYLIGLNTLMVTLGAFLASGILLKYSYDKASVSTKKFESNLRERLMEIVCEAIGDIRYERTPGSIDLNKFRKFGLIPKYSKAKFEDLLTGTHRGSHFSVVEARITKEVRDHDEHSVSATKDKTVFYGMLFQLPSPLGYDGHISIIKDNGRIVNSVKGLFNDLGKRVTIQNNEFEESFEVYASSPEKASDYLTPELIDCLLDLNRVIKSDEYTIAFDFNQILIAASTHRSFLEGFSARMDTKLYPQFFMDLIDECSLSTRVYDHFSEALLLKKFSRSKSDREKFDLLPKQTASFSKYGY